MSDYDTDILTWSERHTALLRCVAAGEAANETPDWPHIIEEIEAGGRARSMRWNPGSTRPCCTLLKAEAWPLSDAVPHWQAEARGFRAQARRRYRASMTQKLDVPGLYADALYALPETINDVPPLPVPEVCPVTLDELLGD